MCLTGYGVRLVDVVGNRNRPIDLSFMASLECDLACAHCMYDSSPKMKMDLDIPRTHEWMKTIDWEQVNGVGLYGGEPGIKLPLYEAIISRVPWDIPRFVITNGTWSTDEHRTKEFLWFALDYKLAIIVSGSKWHTPHQNRKVLEAIAARDTGIRLKGEEGSIIPMGRAVQWWPNGWKCTRLCERWKGPVRIALRPPGEIIFQSCDGQYPVVGGWEMGFDEIVSRISSTFMNCPGSGR